MDEEIEFPCSVCFTPAKPDRINGRCDACGRRTCQSCARSCERCWRGFCRYDVEPRVVMIQQIPKSMLLCEICRKVLLV